VGQSCKVGMKEGDEKDMQCMLAASGRLAVGVKLLGV
jgi:hypothetical protein